MSITYNETSLLPLQDKHDSTGLEENIRLFNKFSTYELKLYRKHLNVAKGEIRSMLPKCRARSDEKFERIWKKNSTLIKLRSSKFEKAILENAAMQVSDSKGETSLSDIKNSRMISGTNKRKRQSDHGYFMCQQSAKRVRKSRLCTYDTNEIYNGQMSNKIHTCTNNTSMIVRKRKLSKQNEHNDNQDQRDIQSPIIKRARLQHVAIPSDWKYDYIDNVANRGFISGVTKSLQNEHNNNHDQGCIKSTNSKRVTLEHNFVPSPCNNDSNNLVNNGRSVRKCSPNDHNNNHDQGGLQSNDSKRATHGHNFVPSQFCDDVKSVANSGYTTNVLSLKASMKFMSRSLKSKKYSSCKNGSYSLGSKSNEKIGNLKPSFPCLSTNKNVGTTGSDSLANYFAQIEL